MNNRLFFASTQRNRDSIVVVLSKIIKKYGSILEIGSGSGEHGVFFQKRFPEIIWQTSDPKLAHRKSISSWIKYEELNKKMPQPIVLIHVAQWSCTIALFRESGKLLNRGKFLMLYGPFKIDKKHTSQSNYSFDNSLKIKNDFWGIRNLEDVSDEAKKFGFLQESTINMPANNFSIIYRKIS